MCQYYMLVTFDITDTFDISFSILALFKTSFSLAPNSYGNFYKKSLSIEYRFIKNRLFIETTDPF